MQAPGREMSCCYIPAIVIAAVIVPVLALVALLVSAVGLGVPVVEASLTRVVGTVDRLRTVNDGE